MIKQNISKILKKYKKIPIQLKASFWFLICSFLQRGISIITTPIFTRILNTSEYGQYSVIMSWENILMIIIFLSLSSGIYQQGLIKFENDRKRYASSMQGLAFALLLFWLIIYALFHDFFNNLLSVKTSYMILLFIIMFITNSFGIWSGEQRVLYKYKKLVIFTLIASILNPLFGIIFANYFQDKVFGRLLGTTVAYIISYLWMFFSQIKYGKKIVSKKYWNYVIKLNITLIPHYLSQVILNSSDRIMIQKIVDVSSAGIYSLAYSLSQIMTLFNTALLQTISPWMIKKIKDNKNSEISNVSYLSLIFIAMLNILLIAFAPELVNVFAPKQYYEAIYVIPPVAMSVYFTYLYQLFSKFEFYYEKTKLISIATMLGAALNLVLNYFFIKMFGYIAAGYTTLLCYIIYCVVHYIVMRKICDESCNGVQPYSLKKLLFITISFMTLGFIYLFLYQLIILRYLFSLVLVIILIIYRKIIVIKFKQLLDLRKN